MRLRHAVFNVVNVHPVIHTVFLRN